MDYNKKSRITRRLKEQMATISKHPSYIALKKELDDIPPDRLHALADDLRGEQWN